MSSESFISVSARGGGGFFKGLLLGYALKKVIKLLAIIVGLFIAGLTYLQYQQIVSVNFNDYNFETLFMTNLGIPLTHGMSAGLAVGFVKG